MNIHVKFVCYLLGNTAVQAAIYALVPAGVWHNVVALACLVAGLAIAFYTNPNQAVVPPVSQ